MTELAIREPATQLTVLSNEQLQYIAGTEFVPPGLRGNLPAILACVATGRALGIADMTALRSIHIIDGKATYSAELMVMLARRAGHSIIGDVTAGQATAHGKRGDNGDTMTVDWTLEMADRAGLLGKSNWKKYPEAMLWARAASQLCRMLFADCFAGATYTTEELGEENTGINGAPEQGDSAAGTPFSYDHEEPLDPPLEQVLAAHAASDASPSSPASEAAPKPPSADDPKYISEDQRTRLFTIATKAGVPEKTVRNIVVELTHQDSTKKIPAGKVYDAVITAIQAKATL